MCNMDEEQDLIPLDELRPLMPRQEAFVREYLIDRNGAQAAIRAGYSPRTAKEIASELLRKPHVFRRLEAAIAQRAARVQVTPDTVLHEMSLLATSDIGHYRIDQWGEVVLRDDAPEGAMRAVQAIKKKVIHRKDRDGSTEIEYQVEVKLWDKPTPLKLLGRHIGLFPDRVEHNHSGTVEQVTRIERVVRHVGAGETIDLPPTLRALPDIDVALAPSQPSDPEQLKLFTTE